jgi:hypothetical protein
MHGQFSTTGAGLERAPSNWRRVVNMGRVRRLAAKAVAHGLFVHEEHHTPTHSSWLVESRSDTSLAHEVGLRPGEPPHARCDCTGWVMTGMCMHVAIALKHAGLGPWAPAKTHDSEDILPTPARAFELGDQVIVFNDSPYAGRSGTVRGMNTWRIGPVCEVEFRTDDGRESRIFPAAELRLRALEVA